MYSEKIERVLARCIDEIDFICHLSDLYRFICSISPDPSHIPLAQLKTVSCIWCQQQRIRYWQQTTCHFERNSWQINFASGCELLHDYQISVLSNVSVSQNIHTKKKNERMNKQTEYLNSIHAQHKSYYLLFVSEKWQMKKKNSTRMRDDSIFLERFRVLCQMLEFMEFPSRKILLSHEMVYEFLSLLKIVLGSLTNSYCTPTYIRSLITSRKPIFGTATELEKN